MAELSLSPSGKGFAAAGGWTEICHLRIAVGTLDETVPVPMPRTIGGVDPVTTARTLFWIAAVSEPTALPSELRFPFDRTVPLEESYRLLARLPLLADYLARKRI